MKTFKAIIIDDEPDAVDYLRDLLQEFTEVQVCAGISDASAAMDAVMNYLPDIIFLDIQMPGKDGIEIIREIRQLKRHFHVIFVTAYDNYAIEALKYAAFDYLLKPVQPSELKGTLARLQREPLLKDLGERLDSIMDALGSNTRLRLNTRTGFIILNTSDIIYIESERNYSTIFLKSGKEEVITMNLGSLQELLPSNFHRASRFHVINTKLLSKVDRKKKLCILTADGKNYELPVNRENIRGLEEMW